MNVLASECSSGCESGWTDYLEQSFLSANPSQKSHGFKDDEHRENRVRKEVDVVEEDLSMVSDASSGPPHFYEDNGCFNDDNQYQYAASKGTSMNKNGGKKHRNKEHRRHRGDQELSSLLDDTASSPLINFSKNNFAHASNQAPMENVFDYSQGFSATHFQGEPAFQDHFCFLQSSPSENQLQNNQLKWFGLEMG